MPLFYTVSESSVLSHGGIQASLSDLTGVSLSSLAQAGLRLGPARVHSVPSRRFCAKLQLVTFGARDSDGLDSDVKFGGRCRACCRGDGGGGDDLDVDVLRGGLVCSVTVTCCDGRVPTPKGPDVARG